MAMNWDAVRSMFSKKFEGVLSEERIAIVVKAAEQSPDGQRLIICLLIDLVGETLPIDVAARLMTLPDDTQDVPLEVGSLIENTPNRDELACSSLPPDTTSRPRYVRVMELSSFITHYAGVGRYLTLNAEDVARVRNEYFADPPARQLGDISVTWSGYNGTVWVMHDDDYREITRPERRSEAATDLNNRLGLGHVYGAGANGQPELVAVRYPSSFEDTFSVECRQPTTCDARWVTPNFYLSFMKLDNWGRTVACSGSEAELRERVHPMLRRLTDGFEIENVGIARPPTEDRVTLLAAAFTRLEHVMQSGGA